jgi:lipopolysaccharide export LptBFGC system permease protein LptF
MNWQTSKTIHRYVLKEVLLVTSLSTLALCVLLLYANLTKHDEALLQALSSSTSALIELISLLLPYALSMGLPFGFSLAVLFCVGRWASDNELTALDSLGINPSGWKFTIYGLSLVICLICCGASLIWAPIARAQFDERKRELAWENLSALADRGYEFEVPLQANLKTAGIDGLAGLVGEEVKKVKLSVGSADGAEWYNLRIQLVDNEENFIAVIHAKSARVTTGHDLSVAQLELSGIDVQMLVSKKFNHSPGDRFISFEQWKQPLELSLNSETRIVKSPKKIPVYEWAFFRNSSLELSESEWAHLNKNIVLGCSPFFLSFLLVPLGTFSGKKDKSGNLFLGVCVCLCFYLIGYGSSNLLGNQGFGWWIPAILTFFYGVAKK